jgi:holliday junction DNA helicase RuvA
MFEYIRGKLVQATPSKAVVDVGGVGYGLIISLKTFQKMPTLNEQVLFYVAPVIREDGHYLFAFLSLEDRNLFEQLISVNGVGPKTAIGILGHVDIADFQMAILQANTALLSKIPGIGKKTAERLVIELKDKFTKASPASLGLPMGGNSVTSDAISALINLGYHPLDAQKAIKKVLSIHEKEPSLSELITGALRSI